MINTLADGTVQDKFVYFYDAAGNLVSKKEVSAGIQRGTTEYTYDALNRLSRVEYPDGSTVGYTYDGAGNRKTMTEVIETVSEDGNEEPKNDRNTLPLR